MPNDNEIPLPDSRKLTIEWLRTHLPLAWWRIIALILFTTFGIGFAAGNWQPVVMWIEGLFANGGSSQKIASAPNIVDHLKEIRHIVHCRIDLSTKEEVLLPELTAESAKDIAQAQAQLQAKLGRTRVVRRLLDEVDRITYQVYEIFVSRTSANLGPYPMTQREKWCKEND